MTYVIKRSRHLLNATRIRRDPADPTSQWINSPDNKELSFYTADARISSIVVGGEPGGIAPVVLDWTGKNVIGMPDGDGVGSSGSTQSATALCAGDTAGGAGILSGRYMGHWTFNNTLAGADGYLGNTPFVYHSQFGDPSFYYRTFGGKVGVSQVTASSSGYFDITFSPNVKARSLSMSAVVWCNPDGTYPGTGLQISLIGNTGTISSSPAAGAFTSPGGASSTPAFVTAGWHSILCVWDTVTGLSSYYIDGVLVSSLVAVPACVVGSVVQFGGIYTNGTNQASAVVRDVRIWTYGLTASDAVIVSALDK